jgi:hypothetical protein
LARRFTERGDLVVAVALVLVLVLVDSLARA